MKLFPRLLLIVLQLCAFASAQEVDVSPSKLREKLIIDAKKLMDARSLEPVLPSVLLNPFIENSVSSITNASGEQSDSTPELSISPASQDALIQAANQVPATGTANLGGQFYLIVGQKKYKTGDKLVVDMGGQPYELVIVSINSTSFSLQKGELNYTRAIRLPNKISTYQNRP